MLGFLRKPDPQWRRRGNEALAAGRLDEAADCYRRAAEADPADPLARVNLGYVLVERSEWDAAAASLQQALSLAGADAQFVHEARYLLGRAQRGAGRVDDALASFAAAVDAQPGFTPPMEEAAAMLQQAGRLEEAASWAARRAQAEPTPAALLALAHLFYSLKRYDEALEVLEAVLAQEAANAAALEGRASLLVALGRHEEALAGFDAALRHGAGAAAVQSGRAASLRGLGRMAEALSATDEALRADPTHRDALGLRATLLAESFRLQEADAVLSQAYQLYPQEAGLRWQRALVRLLAGNFAGGWADYEFRRFAPSAGLHTLPPDYGLPAWTGEQDLKGRTILVIGEQGLGDAMQFARYIPLLQERGARVTFHVVPALHTLFADAFPDCQLVSRGDLKKPDFQCHLMSLPLGFRTTLDTIPARVPYLRSRPELREEWAQRLGPRRGLRVGVVWSGSTIFGNDANRSIALERFRAVDAPGLEFVSLQKEIREADRPALRAWPQLAHYGEHLRSFADTAALVDLMDVVVSVDTSVAHLAGGLARPLWMLLPHLPDWRWMLDREDSPWYPTARLFRQPAARDWDSVLQRVRQALQSLAAAEPWNAEA